MLNTFSNSYGAFVQEIVFEKPCVVCEEGVCEFSGKRIESWGNVSLVERRDSFPSFEK